MQGYPQLAGPRTSELRLRTPVGLIGFLLSHSHRPSKRNVNLIFGSLKSRPHPSRAAHSMEFAMGSYSRLYCLGLSFVLSSETLVCFGGTPTHRVIIIVAGCGRAEATNLDTWEYKRGPSQHDQTPEPTSRNSSIWLDPFKCVLGP